MLIQMCQMYWNNNYSLQKLVHLLFQMFPHPKTEWSFSDYCTKTQIKTSKSRSQCQLRATPWMFCTLLSGKREERKQIFLCPSSANLCPLPIWVSVRLLHQHFKHSKCHIHIEWKDGLPCQLTWWSRQPKHLSVTPIWDCWICHSKTARFGILNAFPQPNPEKTSFTDPALHMRRLPNVKGMEYSTVCIITVMSKMLMIYWWQSKMHITFRSW